MSILKQTAGHSHHDYRRRGCLNSAVRVVLVKDIAVRVGPAVQ